MANIYNDVKNSVTQTGLNFLTNFVPVPKHSIYKETGKLTPDEFVAAGDHLVHLCPTWKWQSGDSSKARKELPADKQFLMTKGVPCFRREKTLGRDKKKVEERILFADDPDGGWVETHPDEDLRNPGAVAEKITDMNLDSPEKVEKTVLQNDEDDDDDDDDDVEDMDDFANSGGLEDNDPATVKPSELKPQTVTVDAAGEVMKTRTYDLFITYDMYYHTPRLWLIGYDEDGRALTQEQMFEDFSEEHARKTITFEKFPHGQHGIPTASIHPCRHAEVMKKLMDAAAEGGNEINVRVYMVIFLKFVQSVIPTIDYDFTRKISL